MIDRAQPLSRDKIVAAAVELVDADGYSAFSLRRLAAHLGVHDRAVRYHVGTREALLDMMVSQVVTEVNVPDPATVDWQDWFRLASSGIRRVMVAHPQMAPLVADLLPTGPVGTELIAGAAQALCRATDDIGAVADCLNAWTRFVVGTLTVEPGISRLASSRRSRPLNDQLDEMDPHPRHLLEELLRRAQADHDLGAPFVSRLDSIFTGALEVLVAGMAARLESAQRDARMTGGR